jgi:hypothetical protein
VFPIICEQKYEYQTKKPSFPRERGLAVSLIIKLQVASTNAEIEARFWRAMSNWQISAFIFPYWIYYG